MVVGGIDGPYEAFGCVIFCFLVKFTDGKELVKDRRTDRRTDGPTNERTDRPSYRDARTHLKREKGRWEISGANMMEEGEKYRAWPVAKDPRRFKSGSLYRR